MNPQEISEDRIHDLLTCAIEGGIGYWCQIQNGDGDIEYPDGLSYDDFRIGGSLNPASKPYSPYGLIAMTDGMELPLADSEDPDTRWTLNREKIQRGLTLLAKEYPRHFANFMSEDEDADTADAFFQLAVLGEIVYG
jgi:hypothetical protein